MKHKNILSLVIVLLLGSIALILVIRQNYNVTFVPRNSMDVPPMKDIAYQPKGIVQSNMCDNILSSPAAYQLSYHNGEKYINPSTQKAPISNVIECSSDKGVNLLTQLTYQECTVPHYLAEAQTLSGIGVDKDITGEFISAGPFQHDVTLTDGSLQSQVGCEWTYRIHKGDTTAVSIVRWVRQANGTTTYPIRIQYDVDTSKQEIADLKKSLVSFIVRSL